MKGKKKTKENGEKEGRMQRKTMETEDIKLRSRVGGGEVMRKVR